MSEFVVGDMNYHVVEMGSGTPLVLLHGFTGSIESWRWLMDGLRDDYRVIAIDLPGHGLTDSPQDVARYEMNRVSDDLVAILRSLEALLAHWLGYSMGGRLALYTTLHHPETARSLILESASPGLPSAAERDARRQQDRSLADRIETNGVPAFVDEWERLPLFATQRNVGIETRSALREQRLNNSALGLANSLRGMGTGVQPPLWDQLSRLELPALLITGEMDEKFMAINRQMADSLPNSRLVIVPDTGHTIHLERPVLYGDIVRQFLRQVSKISGQHLPGAEQEDKYQGSQRHLLEPRI